MAYTEKEKLIRDELNTRILLNRHTAVTDNGRITLQINTDTGLIDILMDDGGISVSFEQLSFIGARAELLGSLAHTLNVITDE